MTVLEAYELINRYSKCPKCGCEAKYNNAEAIKIDDKEGYFKRTCHCGWHIEVKK